MTTTIDRHNVLSFEVSPGGEAVPSHVLLRYQHDWQKSPVKSVVFGHFDQEAKISIEIVVHWTQLTKYLKCSSTAHTVVAVVLNDNTRLFCTSYSIPHHDDKAWYAAPILCRGTFKISTLCSRDAMLEVAGVGEWCYSNRQPEDAKLIENPYSKNNLNFQRRDLAAVDF